MTGLSHLEKIIGHSKEISSQAALRKLYAAALQPDLELHPAVASALGIANGIYQNMPVPTWEEKKVAPISGSAHRHLGRYTLMTRELSSIDRDTLDKNDISYLQAIKAVLDSSATVINHQGYHRVTEAIDNLVSPKQNDTARNIAIAATIFATPVAGLSCAATDKEPTIAYTTWGSGLTAQASAADYTTAQADPTGYTTADRAQPDPTSNDNTLHVMNLDRTARPEPRRYTKNDTQVAAEPRTTSAEPDPVTPAVTAEPRTLTQTTVGNTSDYTKTKVPNDKIETDIPPKPRTASAQPTTYSTGTDNSFAEFYETIPGVKRFYDPSIPTNSDSIHAKLWGGIQGKGGTVDVTTCEKDHPDYDANVPQILLNLGLIGDLPKDCYFEANIEMQVDGTEIVFQKDQLGEGRVALPVTQDVYDQVKSENLPPIAVFAYQDVQTHNKDGTSITQRIIHGNVNTLGDNTTMEGQKNELDFLKPIRGTRLNE